MRNGLLFVGAIFEVIGLTLIWIGTKNLILWLGCASLLLSATLISWAPEDHIIKLIKEHKVKK